MACGKQSADGEPPTMPRLTQDGSEVARHASPPLGKPQRILVGRPSGFALSRSLSPRQIRTCSTRMSARRNWSITRTSWRLATSGR
ncbi:hypothetical protein XAP412_190027 [Xanthomonas phaseoli pv. phaseoli]|uniref:Secreted protein n=1 Tax=Xanthomonas campestris pv. phaseoli TaxID=317013 RepID=A0AB38DXC7_XANCH|nr:hypothetical protein XAP6984_260026 [Xanthomonas phaseoli pv. phaseoli]SON80689.1 hypothetical protein XAP412_190027 [Xanthomonas phaseoli pv. phaseoli]SON85354.1 hypothetical protein XAP7430_200081 [Xanthomonas phaseoli pv. phaseoli]